MPITAQINVDLTHALKWLASIGSEIVLVPLPPEMLVLYALDDGRVMWGGVFVSDGCQYVEVDQTAGKPLAFPARRLKQILGKKKGSILRFTSDQIEISWVNEAWRTKEVLVEPALDAGEQAMIFLKEQKAPRLLAQIKVQAGVLNDGLKRASIAGEVAHLTIKDSQLIVEVGGRKSGQPKYKLELVGIEGQGNANASFYLKQLQTLIPPCDTLTLELRTQEKETDAIVLVIEGEKFVKYIGVVTNVAETE